MVCNPRLAGDVSAEMDCCADLLLLSTPSLAVPPYNRKALQRTEMSYLW